MIKITAVVPDQQLGSLIRETFDEHDEYPYHKDPSGEEWELEVLIEHEHDTIRNLEIEADVIIARGYTAQLLLESSRTTPVVKLPVTVNDVIRSLVQAGKTHPERKPLIMGTRNIIFQFESLSEIFGRDLTPVLLTEQKEAEIKTMFTLMVKPEEHVVIGGRMVCEYAASLGIPQVGIQSGHMAVWQTISEARRVALISRREQEKTLRYRSILDCTTEGILVTDKTGCISVLNTTAEDILEISTADALGRNVYEIFAGSRIPDCICRPGTFKDEIVDWKDQSLAINRTTVILKSEQIGTVISLQRVSRIQETEERIRQKINRRGHIARHSFKDILGVSDCIRETINIARNFSQVDSNISIFGGTGTGKELFAQSIHNTSARRSGPFVAINCAAISETLLESELFGYVEGAFTGAHKSGKPGLFELAHRGTVFLDEISELSLGLQSRLLRVIQEKELMRLGDDKIIPVDIRIISAANKDLKHLVEKGEFREDLFYRLDVLKLELPSLDSRKEDIPYLARYFIKILSEKNGSARELEQGAIAGLKQRNWKGNVRELMNACERLYVLTRTSKITAGDVERILPAPLPPAEGERELSNRELREMLQQEGYRKDRVAERLGIHRSTLWRRMKKSGLI